MVYQSKFVVVVKSSGKILREQGDVINLPFGCEYELLLKNLDSRDASVAISIDGQDVLNGQALIIRAGQESNLEGFLSGTKVTNKFKFIQKTKQIQDHRGDKIDDGIIRVAYVFVKQVEKRTVIVEEKFKPDPFSCPYKGPRLCSGCVHYYTCHPSWNWNDWFNTPYYTPPYYTPPRYCSGLQGTAMGEGVTSGSTTIGAAYGSSIQSNNVRVDMMNSEPVTYSYPTIDEGITVKGNQSDQNFNYGYIGELEDCSNVIVLRLKGYFSSGKEVTKPITTKEKIKCGICGTSNSSANKFCRQCGSSLI